MKYWLIVNMNKTEEIFLDTIINGNGRPTFLHKDKKKAEAELLRLKEKHPHDSFYLFEAVSCAVKGVLYYVEEIK